MINDRSKRVNSAENAIKKSIEHFFLLNFNYPSEAVYCIEQLHKAFELLLREIYQQNGKNAKGMSIYRLINEYWDWEITQKDVVNGLRKTRNKLEHEGELEWEGREFMRNELLKAYKISGQTYQSLGNILDEVFTRGEQNILQGEEINWKDETLCLANLSYQFYKDDPELAIQISNGALEKAVRGFAKSWRIAQADIMPISEVIKVLRNNKYELRSDLPIYYEDYQAKPYYSMRDTDETPLLSCDCFTSIDNVLREVCEYRQDEAIKKALDDTWDIVVSFIKKAPHLDYFEYFINKWEFIVNEFLSQAQNVTFPLLNDEHGIYPFWDEDQAICIYFKQTMEDVNWTENHETLFIEIIEKVCGNKPDNIQIKIDWGNTSFWRN
jgi:hypothetical protein